MTARSTMPDETHTAFFYGTLMAPAVLHRVIHGTTKPEPWQRDLITIRPALLHAYRRHKVSGADYPAICPAKLSCNDTVVSTTASVRGSLVTGLNAQDIRRLDIFEGDQYIRVQVEVAVLSAEATETAEKVRAETYVWADGMRGLESEEWDFDEFQREKMWAWIGETRSADIDVDVDEGFADVDRFVDREEAVVAGEGGERRQNGVARELEDEVEMRSSRDPTGGRGVGGRITRELESLQGSESGMPAVVGEQAIWRTEVD